MTVIREGSYWTAYGRRHGRYKIVEADTRREAMAAWCAHHTPSAVLRVVPT